MGNYELLPDPENLRRLAAAWRVIADQLDDLSSAVTGAVTGTERHIQFSLRLTF